MLPFEKFKKTNTKDNLWIYILLLLRKKGLYGWEIPKIVKEKFNFLPGRITPYRVLYRLEKEGFVRSDLKERRRIYQITEKGKEELKKAEVFLKELFIWLQK